MRIKIKFFAPYNKLVGKQETEMELDKDATVRELLEYLSQNFPDFKPYASKRTSEELSGHLTIFLQNRLAKLEDVIKEGDIVALFPSLSGG